MNRKQYRTLLFILGACAIFIAIVVWTNNVKQVNITNNILIAPTQQNSVRFASTNITIEKVEGNGNAFGDDTFVSNENKTDGQA